MLRRHATRRPQLGLLVLALVFLVGSTGWGVLASSPAATAQGKEEKKKKDKESKKGKKSAKASTNAPAEIGTPAIWEDRGDVAALDLYWGIGGPDSAPKPPFTFDKEDMTGTNPKIKVFDANGVKWNIKFDEEVHAEVACSRIVWACGYMVEESYFVPSGKVQGVSGLTRARKFIGPDGSFTNGMFEKRPDNIARRKTPWSWDSNPFVGTKELSGFAILNALLNNWDAKPDNNNVLGMYDDDGKVKEWYLVADWGGSLGKTGSFAGRSKWDVNDFGRQAFLERGSGNSLKLHYSGKMSSSLKTIPLEHARWFAGIIGQLSDEQLRAAFKAAGATEAEINGFAARLRQKINELKAAVGQVARGQ